LAFLKIASEQRGRIGSQMNPILSTGCRIIRELGLTDSGANF
jgi:hypothetical protein